MIKYSYDIFFGRRSHSEIYNEAAVSNSNINMH